MSGNNYSSTNPRARSVKGTQPPRLNVTLSAVATAITAATGCCPNTEGRLATRVDDVAIALETRHGSVETITAVTCATGHTRACTTTVESLTAIIAATTTTDPLPEVITRLNARGIDAERLIWNIIVIESEKHIGLIHNEIRKLLPHLPPTDSADLLGYGWRGLRMALRQYDPDTGNSLATFACPKINGAIRDGIRSEHHLPKRLTTFARKVAATNEKLTMQLSRTPTWDEIAADLDLAAKERSYLPHIGTPASLDELCTNADNDSPRLLSNSADITVEDIIERSERRHHLNAAINKLPPRQASLINHYFLNNVTLPAAAKHVSVPVETAQRLLDDALNTLRDDMAAWA